MKLFSFGEILWDIYSGDERVIGGAPFNFAAHAAKSGAEAFLISAVGDDELGKESLAMVEKKGVNKKYVSVVKKAETGKCLVTIDTNGIPTYNIKMDVAYDRIQFHDDLEEADALCFGTLSLRSENNRRVLEKMLALKRAKVVFCDLNLRAPFFSDALVNFCLSIADIVKLSNSEADYVLSMLGRPADGYGEACRIIQEAFDNVKTTVITCGENGSYAFDGNRVEFCPIERTKVVSTVGAGDSFGAVFLVETLRGNDLKNSLRLATKRSAYVVSKKEAIPD